MGKRRLFSRHSNRGLSVIEITIGCVFLLGGGLFFFRSLEAARVKRFNTLRRSIAQHVAMNIAEAQKVSEHTSLTYWANGENWKSSAPFISEVEVTDEGGESIVVVHYRKNPDEPTEEKLTWRTSTE